MKPILLPVKLRRFSTAQLLIALLVVFICALFVEKIEGGHFILLVLFSLFLRAAVLVVAIANASLSSQSCLPFQRSVAGDKSFPAGPGSACSLPVAGSS